MLKFRNWNSLQLISNSRLSVFEFPKMTDIPWDNFSILGRVKSHKDSSEWRNLGVTGVSLLAKKMLFDKPHCRYTTSSDDVWSQIREPFSNFFKKSSVKASIYILALKHKLMWTTFCYRNNNQHIRFSHSCVFGLCRRWSVPAHILVVFNAWSHKRDQVFQEPFDKSVD